METSRCTGHCCESFSLPFSPIEMGYMRRLIAAGKTMVRRWGVKSNNLEMVLDMVIFQRMDYCMAGNRKKSLTPQYHYTCKHYDAANKKCTVYESRPSMCRQFGNNCAYRGCTRTCTVEKLDKAVDKAA